jgi:alpha-L-rhamnosidase
MDVAYKLLHQQAYPSWLYTVLQGATTMWERWNSYTKEKGFGDVGMNSFNHYAYGAIGEWLYASVAGIDIDPAQPGYRHILIRPQPGGELTWARGELRSRYGRIACGWRIEEKRLLVDVTIPPNTTATVILPGRKPTRVVAGTYAYTVPWRPKGQSK